jgi:hypothetical protein
VASVDVEGISFDWGCEPRWVLVGIQTQTRPTVFHAAVGWIRDQGLYRELAETGTERLLSYRFREVPEAVVRRISRNPPNGDFGAENARDSRNVRGNRVDGVVPGRIETQIHVLLGDTGDGESEIGDHTFWWL